MQIFKNFVGHIQRKTSISLAIFLSFITILKLITLSHGTGSHPDERHIIMSVMKMSLESWENLNPGSFAYGGLPFYILFFVKEFCKIINVRINYDNAFLVGRFISTLLGIGSCILTYLITQKIWPNVKNSRQWSLLATILLGSNWFFFQNSRYYTVDIFLTFFTLLFFYFVCLYYQKLKFKYFFGIIVSFSLAFSSKISALNLGVFIALLPPILWSEKKINIPKGLILYTLFSVISFIFICTLQPHAVQNYLQFFIDVNRELLMVKGEYIPPYTLQYVGTLPYLYHLKQFFFYTLGPVEVLALLVSIIWIIKYGTKNYKQMSLILLLLVWAICVFIVIGKFQVKFPRYLLPLYPAFMIIICQGIQYLKNQKLLQKIVVAIITLQSMIYLFSYLGIIFSEHTSIIASRWMKDNITKQQIILQPHWDDWLPFKIPLRFPLQSRSLNIYEPDSLKKWREISNELSNADFLIFPSHKITSSFQTKQEKFIITRNFLLELYSEKLPYELAATVFAEFSFGPFVLDLYEGDESLTVYDAPKVQIFQKVKEKNTSNIDLQNHILNSQLSNTSNYFVVKNAKATIHTDHYPSSWIEFLKWLIIFLVIPVITLPLSILFKVKNFPIYYSINKLLGPIALSFFYWLLLRFNFITFTANAVQAYLLICCLFSILIIFWKKNDFLNLIYRSKNKLLLIESLGLIIFIFWVLHRMTFPEIFWSEKPMDFGFLNYFIRSDNPVIPTDPWASGSPMKYYYFSSYFLAFIHKAFHISPMIGFNLALAQIASWFSIAMISFFLLFTQRIKYIFFAVLICMFYCNSEPLRLFFIERKEPDFNLFWSTSRVFSIPGFSEYPLWSFLFSDVHAHVFTLPLTIVFITLIIYSLKYFFESSRISIGLLLSLSISWTFLGLNNGWDFIFYSLFILYLFIAFFIVYYKNINSKFNFFLHFFSAGIVTLILLLPYLSIIGRTEKLDLFWQRNIHEFNNHIQFIKFYGTVLLPLLGIIILTRIKNSFSFLKEHIVTFMLLILTLATVFLQRLVFKIETPLNFSILGFSFFFLVILFLGYKKKKSLTDIEHNILVINLTFLPLAWVLVEHLVFIDRMNTIFKFFYPIWIILILCTTTLIIHYLEHLTVLKRAAKFILIFFIITPISFALINSSFNIFMMTKHSWKNTEPVTLNGLLYLEQENPAELSLYNWINKNIQGTPTIAEAFGISYAHFTRASMHTGLPTVLGWEHHVFQRGLKRNFIREREHDLNTLYSSEELNEKFNIIKKYNIQYIVVGPAEQRTYTTPGISIFFEDKSFFEIVFQEESYALIRPKGIQ